MADWKLVTYEKKGDKGTIDFNPLGCLWWTVWLVGIIGFAVFVVSLSLFGADWSTAALYGLFGAFVVLAVNLLIYAAAILINVLWEVIVTPNCLGWIVSMILVVVLVLAFLGIIPPLI